MVTTILYLTGIVLAGYNLVCLIIISLCGKLLYATKIGLLRVLFKPAQSVQTANNGLKSWAKHFVLFAVGVMLIIISV